MPPIKGISQTTTVTLGFITCFCSLAAPIELSAADKSQPVYSDVPGVTSPRTSNVAPVVQNPPPTTAPPLVNPSVQAPAVPTVPAEEQGREKTLYSFQATDLDLRSALAAFARANNLNIIPDNDVVGTVT